MCAVWCCVVSARSCFALQYRRCLLKSTFSGGAQAAMMEGGRVQWMVWMCDCGTTWTWLLGHPPPLWGLEKALGNRSSFLVTGRVIAVAIVDRPLQLMPNQINMLMADGILLGNCSWPSWFQFRTHLKRFGINLTTIGPMRKNAGH